MVCLLFVDDTDIVILGRPKEPYETMIDRLQRAVNDWQRGLQTTGGALKAVKCTWSLKEYKFSQGKACLKHPRDSPVV